MENSRAEDVDQDLVIVTSHDTPDQRDEVERKLIGMSWVMGWF